VAEPELAERTPVDHSAQLCTRTGDCKTHPAFTFTVVLHGFSLSGKLNRLKFELPLVFYMSTSSTFVLGWAAFQDVDGLDLTAVNR
jgi:hypothetical protein